MILSSARELHVHAINATTIAADARGLQPTFSASRTSAWRVSSRYKDRARSRWASKLSPDRSHQCMTPTRNSTRASLSSVLVSATKAANATCAHKARSSFRSLRVSWKFHRPISYRLGCTGSFRVPTLPAFGFLNREFRWTFGPRVFSWRASGTSRRTYVFAALAGNGWQRWKGKLRWRGCISSGLAHRFKVQRVAAVVPLRYAVHKHVSEGVFWRASVSSGCVFFPNYFNGCVLPFGANVGGSATYVPGPPRFALAEAIHFRTICRAILLQRRIETHVWRRCVLELGHNAGKLRLAYLRTIGQRVQLAHRLRR